MLQEKIYAEYFKSFWSITKEHKLSEDVIEHLKDVHGNYCIVVSGKIFIKKAQMSRNYFSSVLLSKY